jgi:hypothetical protein
MVTAATGIATTPMNGRNFRNILSIFATILERAAPSASAILKEGFSRRRNDSSDSSTILPKSCYLIRGPVLAPLEIVLATSLKKLRSNSQAMSFSPIFVSCFGRLSPAEAC